MTAHRPISAFRPLAALLLLLSVLLGGAIDAAACTPEQPMLEQVDLSTSDGSQPDSGDRTDKHAVCAHGHCHHGAQMIGSVSEAEHMPAATVPHFGRPLAGVGQRLAGPIKEPPRA